MTDAQRTIDYVLAPSDIVWTKLDKPGFPGSEFWFSEKVIDSEYTSLDPPYVAGAVPVTPIDHGES